MTKPTIITPADTPEPIMESVRMLSTGESVTRVEVWYDETDATYGLSYIEDGLCRVGYFRPDGHLIGDWS